jgi:hypothetical protein
VRALPTSVGGFVEAQIKPHRETEIRPDIPAFCS